jgi:hypothetical protein
VKTVEELMKELIHLQNDYIRFLTEIMDQHVNFLWIHGIKATKEEIEKGKKFRDDIQNKINELW